MGADSEIAPRGDWPKRCLENILLMACLVSKIGVLNVVEQ
jgi:hypothetical protein